MPDNDEISFSPAETEGGRRRRGRRRQIVLGFSGFAAIAAGMAIYPLVNASPVDDVSARPQCAPGLPKVRAGTREECVGVTDSVVLDGRFAQVMQIMRAENEFATAGGAGTYVTVAFAGPLTVPDERYLHQLEGAVTGQRRANREQLVGDRPPIKLVLANMGSTESHWQYVTDQLKAMAGGPDRLVAVTGVGQSQDETLRAAQQLSAASLPMIAHTITADVLDKESANGLARVNPRVSEQVAAIARYLAGKPEYESSMLVSSSKKGDLYTDSLAAAFKKEMSKYWAAGGSVENPFGEHPGNEFQTIVRNLCSEDPPDTVFFAGRGSDLPKFIESLSNRHCHPEKITVLSGSDVVRLLGEDVQNQRISEILSSSHNPVSVIYVPLTDPSILRDDSRNPESDQFRKFEREFEQLGFERTHLGDGWGIMAHDAVLTAAQAIRNAAGPGGSPPQPAKVRDELYLLSTEATGVPGASGYIRLSPKTGNRVGMNLPVLRFDPREGPQLLDLDPSL